jgi:hypothetical protein
LWLVRPGALNLGELRWAFLCRARQCHVVAATVAITNQGQTYFIRLSSFFMFVSPLGP